MGLLQNSLCELLILTPQEMAVEKKDWSALQK